jgi:hypothetical protein
MKRKDFVKLVKQFGGWMEGEIARFKTVYDKLQFEKALANQSKAPLVSSK